MERLKLEQNNNYNEVKDKLAKIYICLFKANVNCQDEEIADFIKETRDIIFNLYEKVDENNYGLMLTIANSLIDTINLFLSNKSLEIIELKSLHPYTYSDYVTVGKKILYEDIADYFENIPKEKKQYAQKKETVFVRKGSVGEVIRTRHIALVDNKEYILDVEENTVKESLAFPDDAKKSPDLVVRTVFNISHEERVLSYKEYLAEYEMYGYSRSTKESLCKTKAKPQLVAKVSENLVIKMPSGKTKICLAGSYIVKTNSEKEPFIIVDRGDFNASYTKDEELSRSLRKRN